MPPITSLLIKANFFFFNISSALILCVGWDFYWRVIAVWYCAGFCHTSMWISYRDTERLFHVVLTESHYVDPSTCLQMRKPGTQGRPATWWLRAWSYFPCKSSVSLTSRCPSSSLHPHVSDYVILAHSMCLIETTWGSKVQILCYLILPLGW